MTPARIDQRGAKHVLEIKILRIVGFQRLQHGNSFDGLSHFDIRISQKNRGAYVLRLVLMYGLESLARIFEVTFLVVGKPHVQQDWVLFGDHRQGRAIHLDGSIVLTLMCKSRAEVDTRFYHSRPHCEDLPIVANGGIKIAVLLRLDRVGEQLVWIRLLSRRNSGEKEDSKNSCAGTNYRPASRLQVFLPRSH